MPKALELIGRKFDRLTVLERADNDKGGKFVGSVSAIVGI